MSALATDVVIIGAGVIGASIAFQRTKAGLKVVLVDKYDPPFLVLVLDAACRLGEWRTPAADL